LSITYAEIGTWMKKQLPGWKVGIISGNQELLSKVGLKPDRRIPLYNGRIDSRLCLYSMYAGTKRVFDEPNATALSDSNSAPDADAPEADV
jgi:putative N6-adenine-specific DNA methylase